jgi:ABC-2 type transport system ATP-binding protein
MGHDLLASPNEVRAAIAMTGQFASLDEDLTGRENLLLLARLWGFRGRKAKTRADELMAAFDLSEAEHKQVKLYSGGMRRRLDIAASLVVTPGVLFLDEPTTGLDPNARQAVWRMIRALAGSGVTVLLTTQYLDEADQLAARIAVIDKGKKIAEGTSRDAGIELADFSMGSPSLEEVFFALTGGTGKLGTLREDAA